MTGRAALGGWCLVWLGVLVLPQAALAAVEFTAKVDRQQTAHSQPVRLTLTISSTENLPHIPAPQIDLRAFEVQGPAVANRYQMTNGSTALMRELTYTLYPRKTGKLTIGAASIQIQGRQLFTKPIVVEVTAGRRRSPGQQPSDAIEDNLFIRATADHERAYVGQQVAVTYDLCYRYQLQNVGFSEIPTFAGFWVKDLFVAETLNPKREDIGELPFNVSMLRKVALFPTHSGALRIEPMAVSCSIPKTGRRRSGLFDSIFDRSQAQLVRGEAIEVEVLPLPKKGQPEDFGGAVGRFSIVVEAQPRRVPVGDPVTLRVRVDGEGNFQAIGVPVIGEIDGFKMYDPKQVDDERISVNGYGGSRTLEYILLPVRAGSLQIPAVSFSYFDPVAQVYQTVRSAPIMIDSHGDVAVAQESLFPLTRTEIAQVGSDIRHIKPDVVELDDHGRLHTNGWFWFLQGLIPLSYLGFVVAHRHRTRLRGDAAYARRRRARSEAVRRLERAHYSLEKGDGPGFYDAIDQALRAYLADTANVSAAALTKDECASLAAGMCGAEARDLVAELVALLERCEHARYARAASTGDQMRLAYETAEQIVDALDKGRTRK